VQKHLAIFKKTEADLIFEGKKTIECRFFKSKIAPYNQVSVGDLVYIKPVGEDISGQFRVKKVISLEGLEPADFQEIIERFNKQIVGSVEFWQSHSEAKYGTLIFIGSVERFITSPIKISKRNQSGWVVLN
jgi:hypothetical protein